MIPAVVAPDLRALSPSSLNDLLVCERRWAFSHGIDPSVPKAPPNKWLTLGQATHSAIRAFYDGGNPFAAMDGAVEEARQAGGDTGLAEKQAKYLFMAFQKWQLKNPKRPIEQEKKVAYELGGYPVVGFVDAIFPDEGVDWKTSTRPWDAKKIRDARLQATAYDLGTGIAEWDFVVFSVSDSDEPEYGVHRVSVNDFDRRRFEAMVRAWGPLVQSVDIEDFPIRPGSSNWLCSEKWCDFWKMCPGGAKEGGAA